MDRATTCRLAWIWSTAAALAGDPGARVGADPSVAHVFACGM